MVDPDDRPLATSDADEWAQDRGYKDYADYLDRYPGKVPAERDIKVDEEREVDPDEDDLELG